MSESLRVWPEAWRNEDDRIVIAASLEWSGGERETLWYRIPSEWQSSATSQLDPFAVAVVMLAMRRGSPVIFEGSVSPSLFANLEEYQSIWHFWRPAEYTRVDMTARQETEAPRSGRGTLASFSGGVDACYSVWRHTRGVVGRRTLDVRGGLMVEGFDIPLGDPTFAAAAAGARNILSSVGLPLITAATNWRELEQRHHLNWTQSFGSAVIACLSLFSRGFAAGMLGSGDRYYDVKPHGSTPLTDPLLGTASFIVRHDGAEASRIDKIAALAAWPAALRSLRVCWEGPHKDRNCGECEKCIRTILAFRVNGLDLPPCFERDVTLAQIRAVPIWFDTQADEFHSIVARAHAERIAEEPWVRELGRRLRRYRLNPDDEPWWTRARKRFRLSARLRGLWKGQRSP